MMRLRAWSRDALPTPRGSDGGPSVIGLRLAIGLALAILAGLVSAAQLLAAVTLVGPWAEARGDAIVVSWQTATELDHAGFLVQRGPRPEGPFEAIDASWQPARGIGHGGADYAWTDRDVRAGVDYHYRIEAVGNQNTSEYFGPVCARLGAVACGEDAAGPTPSPTEPEQTSVPSPGAGPGPTAPAGPTPVRVLTPRPGSAQPGPATRSARATATQTTRARATAGPSARAGAPATALPAAPGATRGAAGRAGSTPASTQSGPAGGLETGSSRPTDLALAGAGSKELDGQQGLGVKPLAPDLGSGVGVGDVGAFGQGETAKPAGDLPQGLRAIRAGDAAPPAAEAGSPKDAPDGLPGGLNFFVLGLLALLLVGLGGRIYQLNRDG